MISCNGTSRDISSLPPSGRLAGITSRFSLLTIRVRAGVDLPPGQRESATMEGGAADDITEGQKEGQKWKNCRLFICRQGI